MTTAQKQALVDRQLHAIDVQFEEEGAVKLDDCFRPKLKIKVPDFLVSGYVAIAQRYGEDSQEVREARSLAREHGRLLFGA